MDRQQTMINFRACPFSELIKRDRRLAELRLEYAQRTAEERRKAAEWAYDESIASRLFNQGLALAGQESFLDEFWPDGIAALAIDPAYAPAMLTVGSMEYQLGRKDEATALLCGLLDLPKHTPELEIIIDKAADYFLSETDFERGADFYASASEVFPTNTAFPGWVGLLPWSTEAAGRIGRHPPTRAGARSKQLPSLERPRMDSDPKRPIRRSGNSPEKGRRTCPAGR